MALGKQAKTLSKGQKPKVRGKLSNHSRRSKQRWIGCEMILLGRRFPKYRVQAVSRQSILLDIPSERSNGWEPPPSCAFDDPIRLFQFARGDRSLFVL